ncbi:calcium binding modulator protein-like protein [Xylogone sp. PMI_703]|nr:calcium binding modulator protein-like protein [Xylogone sp. PMI_703]
MAYNKAFNPDSLPAFAEPERQKGSKPTSPQPSQGQYQQSYNQRPPGVPPKQDQDYYRPSGGPGPGPGPGQRLSPQQNRPYGTSPPPNSYNNNYGAPPAHNYNQNQNHNNNNHGYISPVQHQGSFGRPPPQQNRPPQQPMSRPPPSPAPPNGADPVLLPLFRAVDKDRTGQLSERELGAALVNGDWSAFDPQTVRMMIRMFDTDRSGTIGFEEFCGLWGFLAAWRSLFDRFDADRSGNISLNEYTNALVAFGYRLSPQFVALLFRTFDKREEGAISFDLFVQSCISLKRMTDVFKKYDDDRDGFITLSFEDFLTEILRQR